MTTKTIDELMPDFEEYEKARGKSIKWATRLKYALKIFNEYAKQNEIDYLTLNIKQAQEFQAHLSNATAPAKASAGQAIKESGDKKYATSSINGIIAQVKAFYNFLLKSNFIGTNPFKYIAGIRKEKLIPRNLLKEKEFNDFLEYIFEFEDEDDLTRQMYRYRAHVVAELLYSTGMRIGEAALIKESDIDFEKGIIKITDVKTHRERYGFLNEYASEVLKVYVGSMKDLFPAGGSKCKDYIFTSSPSWLCHWFNDKIQNMSHDKNFKSHNFRHSVGYHLLRAGCRIRYIQAILGHAELRSTAIYTKIDKEDLKGILDEYHPRTFNKEKKEVKNEADR